MMETYDNVYIVPVKQVSKTSTDAILFVYGEINPKREEERSGERARKSLQMFQLGVVHEVYSRRRWHTQYLSAA